MRELSETDQGLLLQFCTGSPRPPATGFAHLQGYGGNLAKFRIQKREGDAAMLPTAATCFSTLNLPEYASKQCLKDELLLALFEADGFDEGAVAV